MPRNYDSSAPAVSYVRVPEISITYDRHQVGTIGYVEQLAAIMADGSVAHLSDGTLPKRAFSVGPAQWGTAIPMVVNPTTGQTQGTITWGAIMLAILSGIRADQVAYDALVDAPPPPVEEPPAP